MSDDEVKTPAVRGGNPPEAFRFKKGQSGNPGGRGGKATAAVRKARRLAAEFTPAFIKILAEIAYSETSTAAEKVAAIKEANSYVMAKAAQALEITGKDGGPIEVDQRDYAALDTAQLIAECQLLGLPVPSALIVHEGEIVEVKK